jgi:hypothetical protein
MFMYLNFRLVLTEKSQSSRNLVTVREKIKEDEKNGTCSTHLRDEKFI